VRVLDVEAQVAYQHIKSAKSPREALEQLSGFDGWVFDATRAPEARLLAWCLWLRENGYEEWFQYIRLLNRVLRALTSGDPDEIEFYSEKLKRTKEPEGWIRDFRDYLKERPVARKSEVRR